MIYSQSKVVVSFIVAVYFIIAIFGMSMFIMPSEHGDMMGGGCPLMRDIGSLCQTGIFDHIVHWNMLFATTLATIVFVSIVYASLYVPARSLATSLPYERYWHYSKETPHFRLFRPMTLLFSSGIIQPKIFA